MGWLEALFLGFLQGLTEFLPISSSGHLVVFEHLFAFLNGRSIEGDENLFFNVMLHVGTLVAILAYYAREARQGVAGLLGIGGIESPFTRSNVIRVGILTMIATLPAVPVAFLLKQDGVWKERIETATTSANVSGVGFLITAAVLLLTSTITPRGKGPGRTSWLDALLVGIAQAIAILPGVSRSGMTIAAALALGFERRWAVGFSLLLAVVAISGAGVLEVKDIDPETIAGERILMIVAATVVAGLVGYGAIAWLIRIVQNGRLWYFSVYLVILAMLVLFGFPLLRARSDGGRPSAVDRTTRRGHPGPAPARDPGDRPLPLAGPGRHRSRAGISTDQPLGVRFPVSEGLDLGRPLGRDTSSES